MSDSVIGDLERMPRDSEGFPYYIDSGKAWRASKCCGAPVTYFDDTLGCKKCYHDVDPDTDREASVTTALGDTTLVEPAHGPFRYELPPAPEGGHVTDLQDREQGDPHPQLEQRPGGAYYTGDLKELLVVVLQERDVHTEVKDGVTTVELREPGSTDVAEWGSDRNPDEAMRYALGAYLD